MTSMDIAMGMMVVFGSLWALTWVHIFLREIVWR